MSKTPEGSPSIANVENNSENPSALRKIGQAAVSAAESAASYLDRVAMTGKAYIDEHTGADVRESTLGESETLAKPASNEPEAKKSKADASQGKNAGEGTKSTSGEQASNAKPEAKKSKANTPDKSVDTSGKKTSDGTKSTSEKQASGANKPEAKEGKVNTPQGKQASEGTKSTSEKQASSAKPKDKESKADTSQGEQASGTNESKTEKSKANTSPEKQAPGAAERFMSELRKSLDKKRQDQESSAAGSSEDKQDKDSNPNTGEAQTKEPSPEKREAATNLKNAKDRHAKASAAAKSKNPFGRKDRQAELKAATEQLKKCELLDKAADKLDESREIYAETSAAFETYLFKGKKRQAELEAAAEQLKQSELGYMSIKFADKIEAAKQDPEKQAELAAEMAQAAFASMQETSRVTTDKYDSMLDDRNIVKKAAAKVGKWFNNGGRIAQWIKLGGTGLGVGTATGLYFGAAGWPITAVVGVVTKLGVVGITKQAVLEEHRGEDRIAADARLETTDPSFKNTVANVKIDDVMEHAVNVSVDNLKDMSIERQDALYKKVRASLGKYAAGFILGGFASSLADYLWDNSAHAAGAESQKTPLTPSQSGGDQIPQSGGASSINNSIAKTIINSANPDTLNFNSYDYPWDWAAEKFGAANAMDQLHNLADKAMADGHTVQWFNNPDGSVWMKVDGSSVTADVLKVLNKYA